MTSVEFRLDPAADVPPDTQAALRELHKEAFGGMAPLTTNRMEWTSPQWHITTWDGDKPTSHVGIVVRGGTLNGTPVTIGGVGDVGTSPSRRKEGLATIGLEIAKSFMQDQAVEFGLLVCRPSIVPFYASRGWSVHESAVFVSLFGERVLYSFSPVMVHPLALAPVEGEIDLCGPPW